MMHRMAGGGGLTVHADWVKAMVVGRGGLGPVLPAPMR